ncbi:MAG: hypothetical protein JRH20_02435 [Deltaproteobacteria bacterium]|nr:hypothetical protein [Deltaproteobacteria bacterium]
MKRMIAASHKRYSSFLINTSCWLLTAALIAPTSSAWAWGTAEHIRLGQQIAKPFEPLLGVSTLPVIPAPKDDVTGLGPETFADYVAAPDFARGLTNLLAQQPANILHIGHCGRFWNREGVIDGVPIEDQADVGEDPDSIKAQARPGWLDCISGWTANNSHFGDFARNHYMYYHQLALHAAHLYRHNRQGVCRKAANTLEAWGQHYLTDSVASGHAWNPPGSYDIEWGYQTLTSIQVRMRIHDYLNEHGARMAGALYELGTFWGDHSEEHTIDGRSIPEQPTGNPQKALVLKLSRMGLGQVIAAAECGANPQPEDVLVTRDASTDVRRPYVSDETMCSAMYGWEISWKWWVPEGEWVPDSMEKLDVDLWGLDIPEVVTALQQCKWDEGRLSKGKNEAWLSRYYFNDKRPFIDDYSVSPTIDPHARLALHELGCEESLPVLPPQNQKDLCGNTLCEVPAKSSGQCPAGMVALTGCCLPEQAEVDTNEAALVSGWSSRRLPMVDLGSRGAAPGESSEFLWLKDAGQVDVEPAVDFAPLPRTTQLEGPEGAAVAGCGETGSASVYEARVKFPNHSDHQDKTVLLTIIDMDEGLQVQVNGHLVRYAKRADGVLQGTALFSPIKIPLMQSALQPAEDGVHVVRLIHLNSCGRERPLLVRLALAERVGKGDFVEISPQSGGCAVGHGDPTSALGFFWLWGVWVLIRRRRVLVK